MHEKGFWVGRLEVFDEGEKCVTYLREHKHTKARRHNEHEEIKRRIF